MSCKAIFDCTQRTHPDDKRTIGSDNGRNRLLNAPIGRFLTLPMIECVPSETRCWCSARVDGVDELSFANGDESVWDRARR